MHHCKGGFSYFEFFIVIEVGMKLKGGAARRVNMPECSCFKSSGWDALKRAPRNVRTWIAQVPSLVTWKIEVDLQRRPRSQLAGAIYHDLDRVTQVHLVHFIGPIYVSSIDI